MLRHYFIPLISSALLLITGSYLSAQTHDNALRFSTEALDGTARYYADNGEQLATPQAIQLQKHRIYGVATFGFKF